MIASRTRDGRRVVEQTTIAVSSRMMALLMVIPALLARRLVDVTVPEKDVRGLLLLVGLMVAAYLLAEVFAIIGGADRQHHVGLHHGTDRNRPEATILSTRSETVPSLLRRAASR